jgi:hypothetical protein
LRASAKDALDTVHHTTELIKQSRIMLRELDDRGVGAPRIS